MRRALVAAAAIGLWPASASAQATTTVAVKPLPRPLLAGSQPSGGAPESLPAPAAKPSSSFDLPLDPALPATGRDFTLELEDADLEELCRTMSHITGKRFVVATNKAKGFKATLYSPQKLTAAEAYKTFLAVLQANALTVLPDGTLFKVVETQDVTRQPTHVSRQGEPLTHEERYVTRVHRLEHVRAEEVAANVLARFQTRDGTIVPYAPGNLLILTDTGPNLERMLRILEDIDVGGAREQVWLEPVFYLPSATLQKQLAEVLDLQSKDAPATTGAALAMGAAHVARVVAIDRPNAIVIVGTEAGYRRMLDLVRRMDVPESSEGELHVVPLQYADAKKIATELTQAVAGGGQATSGAQGLGTGTGPKGSAAILEASVKISPEETTNSLLVASSTRDFAALLPVIAKLDQPHRQVYIEAVVLDMNVSKSTQLGLQYHGTSTSSSGALTYGGLNPLASIQGPAGADATALQGLALGIQGPSTGITLPGLTGITVPSFGALLTAMAQDSDTDILSTPHVLATDNMPAEIKVQLHTSLQKNAQTFSTSASSGSPLSAASPAYSSTPQYATLGPSLKITPHVNDSDEVRLDIEEQISDVGTVDSGTLGTLSYNERDATTTLTVRDQQTVVLGGLVRDNIARSKTKIPFLGDLPLLGALFRSTSESVVKQNLVLILTPTIIREPEDLRRIFERKMQERQDFIDHTSLFGSHDYQPPHDYMRTEGLLGAVLRRYREIDGERAVLAMRAPRAVLPHEGVAPIELPSTPSGEARAATVPTHTVVPATPAPGAPAVVRVER